MKPARAVVFDFDGVLADTEGLHLAAFQVVFATRGWTLAREQYFERYLGYDDRDLVRAFARDIAAPLTAADLAAIVTAKTRVYDRRISAGSVLFAGAPAAIARLGGRYQLAIASGSLTSEIVAVLAANGLAGAIATIIGADRVAKSKPAPDSYLAAIAALHVAGPHAVAIEDSVWGLTAARAAGLRTIGVTTSYPAHTLALADHVVSTLDDITTDLVDSLLNVG